MSRYYFHIHSDGLTEDEEGAELIDPGAAHAHALEAIRSLVCDQILAGYLNLDDWLEVEDRDRGNRTKILFREAFEVKG